MAPDTTDEYEFEASVGPNGQIVYKKIPITKAESPKAPPIQYTQKARKAYNAYLKNCEIEETKPIGREKWTQINYPKGVVKGKKKDSGPCFISSVK